MNMKVKTVSTDLRCETRFLMHSTRSRSTYLCRVRMQKLIFPLDSSHIASACGQRHIHSQIGTISHSADLQYMYVRIIPELLLLTRDDLDIFNQIIQYDSQELRHALCLCREVLRIVYNLP